MGECIKECRFGSRMCSCCDWVEKIGWVKEWRRKKNIGKGKRAARSDSDRGDEDGGGVLKQFLLGIGRETETETERAEMGMSREEVGVEMGAVRRGTKLAARARVLWDRAKQGRL